MAEEQTRDPLSEEELEEQDGEPLPDREAMSLINPNVDGIATIAPNEPPVLDAPPE